MEKGRSSEERNVFSPRARMAPERRGGPGGGECKRANELLAEQSMSACIAHGSLQVCLSKEIISQLET